MSNANHAGADLSPATSAGKIQMLDLAALKERIGAKWPRMADPVQQFFEAAIRRNLGLGDIFYRSGELAYLVVFRGLSPVEAELKCIAIAEEVCNRLFGANGESVTLRNLIGHVDLTDLPADAANVAALDVRLERDGQEILITKSAEGPIQHRRPALDDRELRIRLINRDARRLQRIKAKDIALAYRPVWDSAKHAVLTYFCQPAVGPLAQDTDLTTAYFVAEDIEDATFIDCLVLQKCIQQAQILRAARLRVAFTVPVHFATLSRARSWQEYAARYRATPKDIARDLTFIVTGIERGVPHIRLAQEIPKLSLNAPRVLCLAADVPGIGPRFSRTGTQGVGLILGRDLSEAQSAKLVTDIARETRNSAMDSFVFNISSTSIVLGAVDAGIRYLEGAAIRSAVIDPRHAFVQGVEELYRTRTRRT